MPTIAQINEFVVEYAGPFLGKLATNLPKLITTVEADFQTAVTDITKLVTDFVAALGTIGK